MDCLVQSKAGIQCLRLNLSGCNRPKGQNPAPNLNPQEMTAQLKDPMGRDLIKHSQTTS